MVALVRVYIGEVGGTSNAIRYNSLTGSPVIAVIRQPTELEAPMIGSCDQQQGVSSLAINLWLTFALARVADLHHMADAGMCS